MKESEKLKIELDKANAEFAKVANRGPSNPVFKERYEKALKLWRKWCDALDSE